MLSLILILLVVWFVLIVLLAAWTLFFQGYIYSEPVAAIYWRAPAAGTALAVFLCIWVVFDYRGDGRYRPLHEFSYEEVERYDDIWIYRDGKEEHYSRAADNKYRDKNGKELSQRQLKIIASKKTDGEKHVFEPELDAKGNFKDKTVRYYENGKRSRYMDEGSLGQISIKHFGWLVMNIILNLGFLAVWFLSLWLLLRFQWSHALGLAVVFWLVMLLLILPMILTRAENVQKERAVPKTTQAATANYVEARMCMMSPSRTT